MCPQGHTDRKEQTMKTIVKNFNYRNRNYTIVKDNDFYMTVEDKYIDKQGRITKELHYNDGLHTNKTLDGCIEDTQRDLDIEYYKAQGMTTGEAYCKVWNITKPDDVEAIKTMFCE